MQAVAVKSLVKKSELINTVRFGVSAANKKAITL